MSPIPQIQFRGGFVLNPDEFYAPRYRISPFRTGDIAKNRSLPRSNLAIEVLDRRFLGRKWCFTECGKEGIALSLATLALKPDDCVTILTTSGNSYISSCVTREIEKFCNWSRDIRDNTVALFVNHEFGYPYRNLSQLRRYALPIIEDACHSYFANTQDGDMGLVGDFVVFSLPKAFPLQIGGLLSYNPRYSIESRVQRGGDLESYLSTILSYYQPGLDQARKRRLENHKKLAQLFESLGCQPRFELLANDVPGVFIFTVPDSIDLPAMRRHGWANGIECSIFYGEQAFFIPVHHRLQDADLEYFYNVFASFTSSQ
jgi:hypothetical protein